MGQQCGIVCIKAAACGAAVSGAIGTRGAQEVEVRQADLALGNQVCAQRVIREEAFDHAAHIMRVHRVEQQARVTDLFGQRGDV